MVRYGDGFSYCCKGDDHKITHENLYQWEKGNFNKIVFFHITTNYQARK